MAGKRVLLAAEFPRFGATLSRLLPIASALATRGCEVSLAAPAGVAVEGFPFVEAPRWSLPPPRGFAAISYADVLMHGGYAAPDSLRGLLVGWRRLLEQVRPNLLISDFAPTAMLAARLAQIPVAAVGDGFSLPPLTVPLPCLCTWMDVPPDLKSVEGRVLAVINALLSAGRAGELRNLRDLFAGVPSFLCTFAELDHYVGRADGAYFGAVFAGAEGRDWPAGDQERVYVSLDSRHPALPAVAGAIDRLGLQQGGGLAGCDLVVCQSHETVAPALLAGKPLLMLPVFVEQTMTLRRVATQGFGHGIPSESGPDAIEAALRRLVDDRTCRLRAANFARAYDGYQPRISIEAVADEIMEA